jgi:hypothetical protein
MSTIMHESEWLFVSLDMIFLYQTIPCSFHLTCSKDQKFDPINIFTQSLKNKNTY